MAAAALLRGVRGFDSVRRHPTLGCGPSNLFGDVRQVGSIEVSIHGASFKAHGGHREILVNDAGVWVVCDHQVDRPVDLLPHMATEALATGTARRGKLGDPLFLETGPQFGLPPALFPIAFLTAGELTMKTAIPFSR